MSVAKLQLAPPPELDVRTETRVHVRAVMGDALAALDAVDRGDYSSADTALKRAMLAAADGREALQVALAPTPKQQVDEALRDWVAP
jgi:hypothetical protein